MQTNSSPFLWRFVWFLVVTCFGAVQALGQSAGGSIDHVRVLVRDVNASREEYRKVLGFGLPRAEPLILPEGSAHDWTNLADNAYVELIGIVDREKLLKVRPWIVEFLRLHEGAQSVGLLVASAKDVSQHLQSRGIDAPIFELARSKPGEKPVLLVTPKMPHLPEGAVFFLEYPPRITSNTPNPIPVLQPNTAEKILAVWIVVNDIEKASEDVLTLGFRPVRRLKSKTLGADGREFATDLGSIVLLHAKGKGPVAQFARERGDGVMGFTLSVTELEKARALIGQNTKRRLSSYHGFYGTSFLIPAELAAGAWIELAQK